MTDARKDAFIEIVEILFEQNKDRVSPDALDFFEDYKRGKSSNRKEITEKGVAILKGLQETDGWITAKALGEKIEMASRSVSGAMKKLVEDGYAEKKEGNPAGYRVTDKGREFDCASFVAEVDN